MRRVLSLRAQALGALLFLSLAAPAPRTAAETPKSPDLLLVGARVLTASGDGWLDDRAVLIEDGRIVRIAPVDEIDAPEDARRVDLAGSYLIPGLIDLHSHLLLHPYNETPWTDQVLRESLELRTIRAVVHARKTLEAGFTTLRDLGTEGAGFADVALRDAVAQGLVPGPRIFAVTRAVVAEATYGPHGFDPRWSVPKGAQEANGVAGVRRAVREQVEAGADWIKVYADYRRSEGAPSTPTFSQEELDTAVDEATSAGLPVSAHASTPEGIRRAVEAGVKTIEHGTEATPEVLRSMAERGVVLCPTLAAYDAIARYGGWQPGEPEPDRLVQARRMFRDALDAGVVIANGSDVGVFAHGENARELELMVEYGMTPEQALAAATRIAAGVLDRNDLGVIQEGATADLVALGGDPLTDISAVRQVRVVIEEGRVAVNR
jgi:imidazolonepropionase-like amidohydrolase